MYALNYIKKYHKQYLGRIYNEIYDEQGNNYKYYKNLYVDKNILIITEKNVKNNELNIKLNKLFCYINTINNLQLIYSYNFHILYFNSPNDNLKLINSFISILFLNKTLKSLEKIRCQDVIINDYQPIKKIKLYKYKNKGKLINDIDNLIIKCPQIQTIKTTYLSNISHKIKIKFYYDKKWFLNIHCKLNYHKRFPYLTKCPKINNINSLCVNLGYYCSYFTNIKNLEINKNYKYLNKNFMVIVDNIDNLIINDNMDIIITDVNKFKSIKIIKSFNKYIFLDVYFRKLSSYLLFYYNYTI